MKVKLIFFLTFWLASSVFLAHFWVVGSAVWGDGQYYYAYVRSLVIDGDLNFKNEMNHFSLPIVTAKTGLVANKFSFGPALFWLPFFLLAHLFVRGDGYSNIYQIFIGLGSVFYGIAGLYFCYLVSKSLLATIGVWLASNLFFYTVIDPIGSHSLSFFLSSLIIYILAKNKNNFWQLGLLTGLLAATRLQDIIFVLPILFLLLKMPKKIPSYLFFVFIGFLPQLIVWQTIYGGLTSPYLLAGERFYWLRPHLFWVLFSQNNGLFYYSPILILSLIGLLLMLKENRFMAISGLLLFLLQIYIVGSWHAWWGGAAYGGRMFISLLPLFIMGLAAFINKVKLRFVYFPLLLLVLLNFWSMIKFLLINP